MIPYSQVWNIVPLRPLLQSLIPKTRAPSMIFSGRQGLGKKGPVFFSPPPFHLPQLPFNPWSSQFL